jgi:hypothetical protein
MKFQVNHGEGYLEVPKRLFTVYEKRGCFLVHNTFQVDKFILILGGVKPKDIQIQDTLSITHLPSRQAIAIGLENMDVVNEILEKISQQTEVPWKNKDISEIKKALDPEFIKWLRNLSV